MTKFSESIIGKIKCEHIAPVSRWHFLFRRSAFWMLFIFSMILGSLSFSVIMHTINSGDLDMLMHFQGNIVTDMVMFLPYFWLLSLGIFAFVAYFNWRCTRQGYRFRRRWILLGSVGLSIFFGSVFYVFGMGNQIDSIMARTMPFYDESKHRARNELWLRPEIGLIMGEVKSIDSINEQLVIQDERGKIWNIDEKTMIPTKGETIKKGKIVKVIGKKNGENGFIAKEIRRCGDCRSDEEDDNNDDYSEKAGNEDKDDNKNTEDDDDERDSKFERDESDTNEDENEDDDREDRE